MIKINSYKFAIIIFLTIFLIAAILIKNIDFFRSAAFLNISGSGEKTEKTKKHLQINRLSSIWLNYRVYPKVCPKQGG